MYLLHPEGFFSFIFSTLFVHLHFTPFISILLDNNKVSGDLSVSMKDSSEGFSACIHVQTGKIHSLQSDHRFLYSSKNFCSFSFGPKYIPCNNVGNKKYQICIFLVNIMTYKDVKRSKLQAMLLF